jgi:membrane-bound lytic murein transglycosylase B
MRTSRIIFAALAAAALSLPAAANAQTAPAQPGRAIVAIYHAAPGQQLALLKWLAEQDRAAAAAGVGPSQLYAHSDGADWDYLVIQPVTTPAQDEAIEAAGKRLGIDTGPRSALEFRRHILSHTDTFVRGPTTAAAYLTLLGEK